MKRVVVVDDTASIRLTLRALIEQESDLELVGAAENGREAITLVSELEPDVVVMDAQMPVMDGISAVRELRSRLPHLVVIGFTSSEEYSQEILAAGADAPFEKADIDGLFAALREVVDLDGD